MAMSSFKGSPIAVEGNAHETHTTQMHSLGAELRTPDAVFRYAKAGGSNISAGKLQLAPAPKTNHHNVAVATAASAGVFTITVTLGATAAVANEYAEGYVVFSDVAPEGTRCKIASHPAADASATLTLQLIDSLPAAVTTSSEVTLVHNNYNAVVEGTTQTRKAAGIPLVNIAAGAYGWLQTKGVCPGLADDTLAIGSELTIGSSVAGAIEVKDAATEFLIGYAAQVAGVDTEYRPVELCID